MLIASIASLLITDVRMRAVVGVVEVIRLALELGSSITGNLFSPHVAELWKKTFLSAATLTLSRDPSSDVESSSFEHLKINI